MTMIPVNSILLQEILEDLYDLAGERHWWANEPRRDYQQRFKELKGRIEVLTYLLRVVDNPKP